MNEDKEIEKRQLLDELVGNIVQRDRQFSRRSFWSLMLCHGFTLIAFVAVLSATAVGLAFNMGKESQAVRCLVVVLPAIASLIVGPLVWARSSLHYASEYELLYKALLYKAKMRMIEANLDTGFPKLYEELYDEYLSIESKRRKSHLALIRDSLAWIKGKH